MNLTIEEAKNMMAEDGGSLYLSGTGITSLPDNLTVGGSLDLSGTGITSLPDNLTVGGWLDLSGTGITNRRVKKLENGMYIPGNYIYADGILTHVRSKKAVGSLTVYVGKIPGRNVVFDGTYYAHCDKIRDGVADLMFKHAKDRGAEQYKNINLDDSFTVDEAVAMYRIITGACQQGSAAFVNSLGDSLKERYTVREMLQLTKGEYGSEKFAEFFNQ